MEDRVLEDKVYNKLDEIYRVLSGRGLEQRAHEATEIAKQMGDDDLFLRAEIVRLALDITHSVTDLQHANVLSNAKRLLTAAEEFYRPA